jgi:hypothetical protein
MIKVLGVFFMILAMTVCAVAQKKEKTPTERSVSGRVTAATGAVIPGAVVQLKNTKTLQVRSFIANEMGEYYFHGLSTDVDYELKASADGKWSATKTLSSFNTHTDANIDLEVK